MDRIDDELQKILFEVHRDTDDEAARAAIEYATDEIKVAMRKAYDLGYRHAY